MSSAERNEAGSGADERAWGRADRVALAVLVVLGVVGLFVLVHPWYHATSDGSRYIALARALLDGEGYTYHGQPFVLRPPGFAILLAPVIALRGTDFHALNLFVGLFGIGLAVGTYLLARPRLGWPVAFLLAVCLWTNPRVQELCNMVMSDVPGACLLVVCLLVDRRAVRTGSRRMDVVLGVLLGVGALVRSVNLLLVPAVLLARLLAPDGRAWRERLVRLLPIVGAVVVVMAPWALRNRLAAPAPPADQTAIYTYATGWWHVDKGDPSSRRLTSTELLDRSLDNGAKLLGSLGTRLRFSDEPGWSPWPGLTLLALFLVGLARRRGAAELFTAAGLLSVVGHMGFQHRLVLPAWVLLLPIVVEVLFVGLRRIGGQRTAVGVVVLALGALTVHDFDSFRDWPRIEQEHRERVERADRLASLLDEGAVLATAVGPHYQVHLDRPVVSLRYAVRRAGDPAAAEALIDAYGVNTVFLHADVPNEAELLPYFTAHCLDRRQAGELWLLRVR